MTVVIAVLVVLYFDEKVRGAVSPAAARLRDRLAWRHSRDRDLHACPGAGGLRPGHQGSQGVHCPRRGAVPPRRFRHRHQRMGPGRRPPPAGGSGSAARSSRAAGPGPQPAPVRAERAAEVLGYAFTAVAFCATTLTVLTRPEPPPAASAPWRGSSCGSGRPAGPDWGPRSRQLSSDIRHRKCGNTLRHSWKRAAGCC